MVSLLSLIFTNPLLSFRLSYTFSAQVLIILLKSALLPYFPGYLSLRTQLQRAYLASAALHFPSFVHRLPVTHCPSDRARKVGTGWTGYVIPGRRFLSDFTSESPDLKRCVVLYAHGGGYAWGEARQYLNYMERWVLAASKLGIDLAFLSVEYPLSTESQHPTQLQAFLKGYQYLLDEGVSPKNIIFMGDSAGAALSIMAGIALPSLGLPQPAGSVLISPWLDTSLRTYESGSPLVETDYVVTANTSVPYMFNLFRGSYPGDSPEVNPLYRAPEEISHLNPQLILVGGAEMALDDGKDWAALCKKAGVRHELVIEWGQLHIYAMGSEWLDPKIRAKTDAKIIGWIKQCVD